MRKIFPKSSHGLKQDKESSIFSKNHYASSVAYSPEVQAQITGWGLMRVAGNQFICPSTRDFWKVQGNKIVKLVGSEVDAGESLAAAPEDKPEQFLEKILEELEF